MTKEEAFVKVGELKQLINTNFGDESQFYKINYLFIGHT
jgi:hypothetical protein